MAYYRKKPLIIEAFRFGFDDAPDWWMTSRDKTQWDDGIYITTLEGDMRVDVGDWVIQGVAGELYPCKDAIFQATYQEADGNEQYITGWKQTAEQPEPASYDPVIDG
jgi:hypothetical protein